jgi:hypothetical protein
MRDTELIDGTIVMTHKSEYRHLPHWIIFSSGQFLPSTDCVISNIPQLNAFHSYEGYWCDGWYDCYKYWIVEVGWSNALTRSLENVDVYCEMYQSKDRGIYWQIVERAPSKLSRICIISCSIKNTIFWDITPCSPLGPTEGTASNRSSIAWSCVTMDTCLPFRYLAMTSFLGLLFRI